MTTLIRALAVLILVAVAGCRDPGAGLPARSAVPAGSLAPESAEPGVSLPAETLPLPSIRLPSAPAPETDKPVVGA